MGGRLIARRQIDDARRAALRGLDLAVTHGEQATETSARCVLGEIALAEILPDEESARAHYTQAFALSERLGLVLPLARCHLGLGRVESLARHADLARGHLESAGRVYRQAGSKYWIARVDEALAEVR